MAKQTFPAKKRVAVSAQRKKTRVNSPHKRRALWFGVLAAGLLAIQLTYNIRGSGQPRVLGYATNISADILLADTNNDRANAGLPPLQLNTDLSRAANAKAENMVTENYWNHVSPEGTTPWQFIERAGYHYSAAGENLAYGFTTSDQVVAAWLHSPEHRANLLGQYADVGFGLASGSEYQHGANTVVVALYGLPASAKTASKPIPTIGSLPPAEHVAGLSTVAAGTAPWATYASLALIGASFMGFAVAHLETLRLGWHSAARYAVVHPLVDAAVLLGIALIIVQAAGGFIR